jgi:hypothetical protein
MCITRDGSRNKAMVSEKKDGGIVLLKEAPGALTSFGFGP